jgi:hypothetical protein
MLEKLGFRVQGFQWLFLAIDKAPSGWHANSLRVAIHYVKILGLEWLWGAGSGENESVSDQFATRA